MKIGMSTYSLRQAIGDGRLSVTDIFDWTKERGGEHVEICPIGYSLTEEPHLVNDIVAKSRETGIAISSYTIGAELNHDNDDDYRGEIERLKAEVDICAALGAKFMRHDVASLPPEECHLENFEKALSRVVPACQEVADHAAKHGITTSLENHGYLFQHSERVQRLIRAVGRENYRTTMDVGNFICADERPEVGVRNNASLATVVHLKDFYLRPDQQPGWGRTRFGTAFRGAIVGQGDLDLPKIIRIVHDSGFRGYVSIEFEGMEDCLEGAAQGMAFAKAEIEKVMAA